MYGGTVFEFNSHRFIVQFHKEPIAPGYKVPKWVAGEVSSKTVDQVYWLIQGLEEKRTVRASFWRAVTGSVSTRLALAEKVARQRNLVEIAMRQAGGDFNFSGIYRPTAAVSTEIASSTAVFALR